MRPRTILITHSDISRLRRLLKSAIHFLRRDRPYLLKLEQELQTARIVEGDQIPQDVATLEFRVHIRDLDTGKRMAYQLVFPKDFYAGEDRLSVLAPLGTAILGRRAGDVFDCEVPAGVRRLKLEKIEKRTNTSQAVETAA